MISFSECRPLLHDRIIRDIQHCLNPASILFVLDDDIQLACANVFCYRAESYLYPKNTISADAVYIVDVRCTRNDNFVQEVISSLRSDGSRKWSEDEDKYARPRGNQIIHLNIYCIDWEFDIVCESFSVLRRNNVVWHSEAGGL